MTRTLLTLMLLCGLAGCSTWWGDADPQPLPESPQVRLLKVEPVKLRLLQQDLRLYFEIDNPGDSRLLVRGLRFRILLDDLPLADDEVSQWFFVAAGGHEILVVPLRTNLWQHARGIARRLKHNGGPIPYRLEGRLKTGLLFRDRVRIDLKGEIMPPDHMTE